MSYPIVDAVLIPVGTVWTVVAVFRGPDSAQKAANDRVFRRHGAVVGQFFDGPRKIKVGMMIKNLPR